MDLQLPQDFSGFNNSAFNHIALVRNSGVLTVYVNGTSRGTAQTYNTNYTGQPNRIGSSHTDTNYFTGNIDEFRTSSIARYTSAFTPPSSEFSVDSNTFSYCILMAQMDLQILSIQ